MTDRRDLLLVGVGEMGRPYLTAARRLRLTVRAVERVARADSIAPYVDGLQLTPGSLDEQWIEGAALAAAAHRPHGVVAFTESQVMAAAMVQDELGLPGPSMRASAVSRNKAMQRALCGARGIRQPDYLLTADLAAAEGWAAAHLPVVLKPLSMAGSAGVELVHDVEAFRAVAARRAAEGSLLIEAAVGGPEYSWEALVHDGKLWFANLTAKETTGPPYFIEVAHRVGVKLPEAEAVAVDELGRAVIATIGMRTGMVHLEFKAPAGQPTLIEVAVRTPGDYLMDLLNLTYGVDWFELVVRLAMGLPLPTPPSGPERRAASYFLVPAAGVVTAVEGLEEVQAHPAVVKAGLSVQPGSMVPHVRSSAQRAGYVVLATDDSDELEEVLSFVRHTLIVHTRPD